MTPVRIIALARVDAPRAAVGTFPYPHRTVAEVWKEEARAGATVGGGPSPITWTPDMDEALMAAPTLRDAAMRIGVHHKVAQRRWSALVCAA